MVQLTGARGSPPHLYLNNSHCERFRYTIQGAHGRTGASLQEGIATTAATIVLVCDQMAAVFLVQRTRL